MPVKLAIDFGASRHLLRQVILSGRHGDHVETDCPDSAKKRSGRCLRWPLASWRGTSVHCVGHGGPGTDMRATRASGVGSRRTTPGGITAARDSRRVLIGRVRCSRFRWCWLVSLARRQVHVSWPPGASSEQCDPRHLQYGRSAELHLSLGSEAAAKGLSIGCRVDDGQPFRMANDDSEVARRGPSGHHVRRRGLDETDDRWPQAVGLSAA